jgi:type IV pili sensor histidine kinase/response regulator
VFAGNNHEIIVGRYLTTSGKALPEQTEPLSQPFQAHFPSSVRTIEEAVRYLLSPSGYRLVGKQHLPVMSCAVLSQSLPNTVRMLGLLSLQEGLLALVGDPFILLVDPVHRLVSFQLRGAYYPLYLHA